jgi:site-specific DNA recombinase
MKRNTNKEVPAANKQARCAIYTRKSSEEGLEQEFNSLDAQRESGEAYVKSQASEGWVGVADRYDDGGYSGGNVERPALKRLLADIEAGKIDCVVVYKVDRLSRSLLDFARMMESFEKRNVSFVSVTQQFNTATSMGRLVLNVLLSFAQFEREIISERTRDKIAATRRKGKWAGGHPVLGYDIDPNGLRLVVNAEEAQCVREIFDLYLQHESLLPVVQELHRRRWVNKKWRSRKGVDLGGKAFTRTSLHKLLTNAVFIGKVRYKTEHYEGEHTGIVEPVIWQQVAAILERNRRSGGAPVRNKYGAFLKGLIRCVPCDCSMSPHHVLRKKNVRHRYYVCVHATGTGWKNCPNPSVPAKQIENLVLERVKATLQDSAFIKKVLEEARDQEDARSGQRGIELRGLEKELRQSHREMQTLTAQIKPGEENGTLLSRLADVQHRVAGIEERVRKIKEEIRTDGPRPMGLAEISTALKSFTPVWDALTMREQARMVELLIERVNFEGVNGKVSIVFRATGIKTLANQLARKREGVIA